MSKVKSFKKELVVYIILSVIVIFAGVGYLINQNSNNQLNIHSNKKFSYLDQQTKNELKQLIEAREKSLQVIVYASFLFVFLTAIFVVRFLRSMLKKINLLTNRAINIQNGSYHRRRGEEESENEEDYIEFVQISHSLTLLAKELSYVENRSKILSSGQFFEEEEEEEEEEVILPLRKSLFSINRSLMLLHEQAKYISNGNYEKEFVPRGDNDRIGLVLKDITLNLRKNDNLLKEKSYLQDGVRIISEIIIAYSEDEDFYMRILDAIVQFTDVQKGILYKFENECLNIKSTYCFDVNHSNVDVSIDEGLIGQAMRSKIILSISSISALKVGMGEIILHNYTVIPLVYKNEIAGCIELYSTFALNTLQKELLQMLIEPLTLAILRNIQIQKIALSEETLKQQYFSLQLAQSDLLAKTKELEASNTYKTEFLANMSHELRTPLNAINVLSKILHTNDAGNLSSKEVEQAKVIHDSGSDLLELINNILDLSKIEAQKITIHEEKFSLNEIVKRLYSLFKPIADEKGVDLLLDTVQYSLIVKSDKEKLSQIIKNFLSNALKFTPKGKCVTLHLSDDLLITVRDEGIGIAKDRIAVIFEKFIQADGSTSRKYGGTGLGLSISQELAALLHATIEVQSVLNEGASFSLRLPLDSLVSESSMVTSSARNSLKILLVDEDIYRLAKLAKKIEAMLNVEVIVAMDEEMRICEQEINPDIAMVIDDLSLSDDTIMDRIKQEAIKGSNNVGR